MISETDDVDDEKIELPSRQTTENQGRPPSLVHNIIWLHRSDYFTDFYLYLCMILVNSINTGIQYLIDLFICDNLIRRPKR